MRYARSKQLALHVCKGPNVSYKHFKKMRGIMGNLKIEENVTLAPYCDQLDSTFKWHRIGFFSQKITISKNEHLWEVFLGGRDIQVKTYK
ncbi:hypothetical protein [Bacillus mycoides]|uniref:hypothetical protein n=1 Tax=Bacillus mycoides TaxID=1405 RepID=UPI000BF09D4A|nr:hypothetical protein [Bacillus mycoides]PEK91425.1 hypothetical protein CN600_21205 [Bacillus mycoides]